VTNIVPSFAKDLAKLIAEAEISTSPFPLLLLKELITSTVCAYLTGEKKG